MMLKMLDTHTQYICKGTAGYKIRDEKNFFFLFFVLLNKNSTEQNSRKGEKNARTHTKIINKTKRQNGRRI